MDIWLDDFFFLPDDEMVNSCQLHNNHIGIRRSMSLYEDNRVQQRGFHRFVAIRAHTIVVSGMTCVEQASTTSVETDVSATIRVHIFDTEDAHY